ncbi:5-formyltetrahydrofolate cyclo-ligase [Collinsella tanakaei]|uniref:5-formyltetrahydrofolate cyclo-ligase n=1 Tax=Collinsella tanakaei TaxID=626935 RepID=UPI0025A391DC|nr:5-formyltetrahydrofolate cyclo-ligase [Collinsella tanakaei]MDM8246369.1 5-formyltetrahydrofolate cyclo-ligase [Collinsella tanakaei]
MGDAQTKQAMRASAIAARDSLSAAERARRSAAICDELLAMAVSACKASGRLSPIVAVYAAMRSEVDLDMFIRTAYDRGWRVAFPCMQRAAAGQSMCMRAVSFADYRDGSVPFIKRPVTSFVPAPEDEARFPLVDPREIDVMAVPLVAFDDTGARLGYGGGNYDRYLPLLRPDCLVAGVAFAEQRVDRVPVEPHDRPLSRIIWA